MDKNEIRSFLLSEIDRDGYISLFKKVHYGHKCNCNADTIMAVIEEMLEQNILKKEEDDAGHIIYCLK